MENMMELRNGSFLSIDEQKLVEKVGNASEENEKALELFGHDMYSQGYWAGAANECDRSKHTAIIAGFAAAGAATIGSLVTYLITKNRCNTQVYNMTKFFASKNDDYDEK